MCWHDGVVFLCDQLGQEAWCCGNDATNSGVGGNITKGGFAVDATIFWGSVVLAALLFICGKSCVLCVLFSMLAALVCPWVLGIVLLFCAAHLA